MKKSILQFKFINNYSYSGPFFWELSLFHAVKILIRHRRQQIRSLCRFQLQQPRAFTTIQWKEQSRVNMKWVQKLL